MRVLITGATGLLGGHLIKELQQRGEDIRALVLPVENADKLEKQGVEVVRGDITDAGTLEAAVQDVELIFHLAGMMGVWRPLADYRLTKAEGDRLMRRLMLNSEVETVILRPGTFFGPGDRLHFGRMAQKMKDGKGVIIGRGDNHLPFCYITDIVQGFMLAAYHENAPGNVYNITNDRPLTQLEMFNEIADAVNGIRPTRHLPYLPIYYGSIVAEKVVAPVTRREPFVTTHGALMFGSDNKHSIEKARRELGFEPKVDLRTGIRFAAEWFKAGGMNEVAVTQASQHAPLAGAMK